MLPTLLALSVVLVPPPVLSPEPLTAQPDAALTVNVEWWTHDTGFIPSALQSAVQGGAAPARPHKPGSPGSTPGPATDSGMGSNVEQWRSLVASYFGGETDFALCVIRGESGGNPGAQNPRSSAAGLWQFLRSTWDDMVPREVTGGSYDSGAVFDPVAATRAAKWLRDAAGWSQWNAASRC